MRLLSPAQFIDGEAADSFVPTEELSAIFYVYRGKRWLVDPNEAFRIPNEEILRVYENGKADAPCHS